MLFYSNKRDLQANSQLFFHPTRAQHYHLPQEDPPEPSLLQQPLSLTVPPQLDERVRH